jgi:adenine/guanine/hypoxanthine permease
VKRYHWAEWGDINAFFGLMLDNLASLVLAVSLLEISCKFPAGFAFRYMIPGTALGVLVGDLLYTWMAFRLARRTGRDDVTAMPLGLDTPSTFGMVFFVLGPAFSEGKKLFPFELDAATYAWQIGMGTIIASGVFKLAAAFVSDRIRRIVPRAGLLGSLTAIALVMIAFLPLLDVLRYPIVGFMALAVILTALVAKVRVPGRIPGALAALVAGGIVYYAMRWTGTLGPEAEVAAKLPEIAFPNAWLTAFQFEWLRVFPQSLRYLPVVIPFALATVIGGIDCTESAAVAGDTYRTRSVIAVEAFATLVAGFSGGVIQSTPYIGHPAYKIMGGRAAYTLATALFVGSAGLLGYFAPIYAFIPKAAIFPILIFIGLEITAQSFLATKSKYYAALGLACLPALAALIMIFADKILAKSNLTIDALGSPLSDQIQTLRILSAGFIVTSLLWASAMANLIDRDLQGAARYLGVAALCALVGIIHSPTPGSPLSLPWALGDLPKAAAGQTPIYVAAGYAVMAILLAAWGRYQHTRAEPEHAGPTGK